MFGDIIKKRLIENDDQAFVANAFAICKEKIRDTTVVKEISYDYYYAMAYTQATKSNWTTSLEYANHAFKINAKNINLQELILRGVMFSADGVPANEKVSTVEGYAKSYPFLRNNKMYKALLIYSYAFESYTNFSQNAEVDGYSYMKKTEAAMKSEWTKIPLLDQMIGLMYAEAGAYHFRKKQYAKAKEILLEGLKVAPNHSEIKARLEIVEDESMRPSRP
jgi:tetratricopeptide (TPR) repeat protein